MIFHPDYDAPLDSRTCAALESIAESLSAIADTLNEATCAAGEGCEFRVRLNEPVCVDVGSTR